LIRSLTTYERLDAAGTMAVTMTEKGDLISRDTTTFGNISVGTNGTVLTANSSATVGLSWETPTDYTGLILALGG
jgi:hypothetical protein